MVMERQERRKDTQGDYVPVDMPGRRRGQRIADWPSLLDPEAADAEPTGGWDGASLVGAGMKTGAGGHPQPYDAHGRYTGPTGGVFDRSTGEIRTFGVAGDEGGEEYKGGEETQAETAGNDGDESGVLDVILASDGGLSGDGEVRGPVTPPQEPAYPPPPPAPKEPHLTYSQKSGELARPDGVLLGQGYAGQKNGKNNPAAEADEGVGPIPQGNWRIQQEVDKATRERNGWPEPAFKLEPDPATAERVRAMGRDPGSFYVHAKSAQIERQGNGDSKGCIALDKPERNLLKRHIGGWIRVEK